MSEKPDARRPRLILASRSPRRIRLIRELGLDAIVQPSSFDERRLDPGDPAAFAHEAAWRKAQNVAREAGADLIAGMDTVVHLDGAILHQPRDAADAARILAQLSGRTHRVTTGLALLAPGGADWRGAETTRVRFRALSPREIADYIATGHPLDKAGAYGIQGAAADFVDALDGDYFNVVGLPLRRFLEGLSNFMDVSGIAIPPPPAPFHSWLLTPF